MLKPDEIITIIDHHVFSMDDAGVGGVLDAAEAIAALLTPVHQMAQFIWQQHSAITERAQYIVTEPGGKRYRVDTRPSSSLLLRCTPLYNKHRWCENDENCIHVKAVRLYREQEESK